MNIKGPDDNEESSIEEFEDFDPEDYLEEETTHELDFTIDEQYRGEPAPREIDDI